MPPPPPAEWGGLLAQWAPWIIAMLLLIFAFQANQRNAGAMTVAAGVLLLVMMKWGWLPWNPTAAALIVFLGILEIAVGKGEPG